MVKIISPISPEVAELRRLLGELVGGENIQQRLTTIDTNVDDIESLLNNGTYGLSALQSIVAGIETDLGVGANQTISARLGFDASGSAETELGTIKSLVQNLGNATAIQIGVPMVLEKPETGTIFYHVPVITNLGTNGALGDPDNDEIFVKVFDETGVEVTGVAWKYSTNAALAQKSGGAYDTWFLLEKSSTGVYDMRLKITSTEVVKGWTVRVGYYESAAEFKNIRSTQVVDYRADVGVAGQVWEVDVSTYSTGNKAGDYLKTVRTLLENGTYGLSALDTDLGTLLTRLGTPSNLGGGATVAANLSDIKTQTAAIEGKIDVIDGYHDVPSADASTNLTIRDVVGNKNDTVAGNSLVALAKQILANMASDESHGGTLFKANKSSAALAQAAAETVVLTTADGFDCINAKLNRLIVTVTGASTSFTVQIYEDSGATLLLNSWEVTDEDLDINNLNLEFINQNVAPDKNIYVKITNVADASTSTFAVELRGTKMSNSLA